MPTVSELKEQARTLEQQGNLGRALAIYEHILKHVEGTPAIVKLLPLYVKVGDLHAKLNQPTEAVDSYEKAAEQYAEHGSAQRISALCAKIVRLAPDRSGLQVDLARRLIEHGHVGSARDVLSDYALSANLDKAQEALDDLAGRPDEEVQPMLERLLESGLDAEPAHAEETAERVSSHLMQVADQEAGELTTAPVTGEVPAVDLGDVGQGATEAPEDAAEPLTQPMFDIATPVEQPSTPLVEEEPFAPPEEEEPFEEAPVEEVESEEPEEQPEPPRESVEWISTSEPTQGAEPSAIEGELAEEEPEPAQEPAELPSHLLAPEPRRRTVERPLRPTPSFMTRESERHKKSPVLFAVVGFVLGLVVGAGLMMAFGGALTGSATDATVPVTRPDTTPATAPVTQDPIAAESTIAAPIDTDTLTDEVDPDLADTLVAVTPEDTAEAAAADSAPGPEVIPDAAPPLQLTLSGNPIVVRGLEIESIFEAEYQGRAGFRVVHVLGSGDPFTIESYADPAGPAGTGQVTVNTTPPDTVVGILRMDGYLVIASGVMPEDSLRTLMGLLVEGEPPDQP
jgi:tetratricopeptide (TPR) repeat protein